MTKRNHTMRALLASVLSLLLCFSMLIGSTFAWFTDSATTGVNTIVAGNLDIKLEYLDANGAWVEVDEDTKLFKENALWEPGYVETAYLRVSNAGTLALKYQLDVMAANETAATNVLKQSFKLSDHIKLGIIESDTAVTYTDRADAVKAVEATATKLASKSFTYSMTKDAAAKYYTLVVYMPDTVGNEANYRGTAPSIDLGVVLNATQLNSEEDSFDEDYDIDAPQLVYINDVEYASLDEAIAAAENGDTIKVQGTHTLAGSYAGAKTLTIYGIDGAALINLSNGTNAANYDITFDNVTIQGYDKEDTFYTNQLAHATKATYKNCIIKGLITTYCDSTFESCVFKNTFNDQYSVFCYGGNTIISDCTFNTRCSKAVKLYNEGTGEMTLTVEDCEFIASTTDKAAIEIDSTYTTKYTVDITNCTINSYYERLFNDKSTNSVVTVDGSPVVMVNSADALADALNNTESGSAVNIVVIKADTYNLPDYYSSMVGKDITISSAVSGDNEVIFDASAQVGVNGVSDLVGTTVTFEGVTVKWSDVNEGYQGLKNPEKVVYKDCTIIGTQFMYSSADFINCKFETGNGYSVYTRAPGDYTFTDCIFTTGGRAIMLYNDAVIEVNITLNGCTFSDDGTYTSKAKAAVETGDYGSACVYNIELNDCKITEGFETNNSTNALWGNKDNMPTDRLNVIIDSVDVY